MQACTVASVGGQRTTGGGTSQRRRRSALSVIRAVQEWGACSCKLKPNLRRHLAIQILWMLGLRKEEPALGDQTRSLYRATQEARGAFAGVRMPPSTCGHCPSSETD